MVGDALTPEDDKQNQNKLGTKLHPKKITSNKIIQY